MRPKAAVRPRSRTPRRCGVPTQPQRPPPSRIRPWPPTAAYLDVEPPHPTLSGLPPWSTQSLSRSLSWTLHDPPCVHAEWPGLRWCLAPRRRRLVPAQPLHARFLRLDLADSCRSRFLRLAWIRLRWPSPDWLRRPRRWLCRPDHHQVWQVCHCHRRSGVPPAVPPPPPPPPLRCARSAAQVCHRQVRHRHHRRGGHRLRRPCRWLRRPDRHQVCQVRRPDRHQEPWSRRSWSRSR